MGVVGAVQYLCFALWQIDVAHTVVILKTVPYATIHNC
jgi:hypothetical protein